MKLPSPSGWSGALVCVGLTACCAARADSRCLAYAPAQVKLSGRLSLATSFGPPGFGEDPARDSRERYGLLTLDKPACVDGRRGDPLNEETERRVRAVQLVMPDGRSVRRLAGRHVSVSGTLFHQHTGHHHTAVLITVDAIQAK